MAYYKVSDTELSGIADKIRSKGGTSAQLEFPTGFENAIDAIPTGTTPTGTKNISTNGTHDVAAYAYAAVAVPASAVDSGTKQITSNGTGQDVVGYAAVDVAVPNSYSPSDEGKVVSNGALVAQTSDTVTTNNTYDTTLINSLTVNVSGGGGGLPADMTFSSITYTPTAEIGTASNYVGSIVAAIIDLLPSNTLYVRVTHKSGTQSQYALAGLVFSPKFWNKNNGTAQFYRYNPAGTPSLVDRNDTSYGTYSIKMLAGNEYLIEYITGSIY